MMEQRQPIRRIVDLTDPGCNLIYNMTVEEARACVAAGDPAGVRGIDGYFALVGREGVHVRMARSLGVPMRYFIAKEPDGPGLVVAHRIDRIKAWLEDEGLGEQFHPSYTRMVPAHYITDLALLGCPDPNPAYTRFFEPKRQSLPTDLDRIGAAYIGRLAEEVGKWLERIPTDAQIGVCFSGGIDSGAVFLTVHYLMTQTGANMGRLKAFTLSVDGGGEDLEQARQFLTQTGLSVFHEPVKASADSIDFTEAIRVVEDYKPLDVQAAAMTLALCRGIRRRYPDWTYLIDGDGGDENLKDYPIEENPELTIRSVLNNPLLYQEGWGVESIKHSLVYSGGLSRGCTRTFAPAAALGLVGFSPFTLPAVMEVAEGIPFIELTDWRHEALYRLKGEIVARGIKAVTGRSMPVFEKRRFQHGAIAKGDFQRRFPEAQAAYRRTFQAIYDS